MLAAPFLFMPELARFYGIIIRMFVEAGEPHKRPHFHAYYTDQVAVYGLSPVELIAGGIPRKQARLVEAWGELHEDELNADWQRLQSGQLPAPIEPLK